MRVHGLHRIALCVLVGLCAFAPALAALDPAEPKPTPAPSPTPVLRETIEVTATRLPEDATPIEQVPSHVTVLDRAAIEASGAWTLQELLALESGAVLYDPVGNAIETRFDLRGFAESPATRVYLDGAPMNDTRNNELALQLLPLDALERIEIVRGSAANSAGGRSEAGVIHLLTRDAGELGGSLSLTGGSDGTSIVRGGVQGRASRFGWSISGFDEETDGFRDNAGGDVERLSGTLAVDLGAGHALDLLIADSRSDLGNPGALTQSEIETDPSQAPYNPFDFANRDWRLFDVGYRGTLAPSVSLRANAFVRSTGSDVLTTGRAAPTFGGFFVDLVEDAVGGTAELALDTRGTAMENELVVGAEWLDGTTDARGTFTPPSDPAGYAGLPPDTINTTDARTLALYVQDTLRPTERVTLVGSLRYDGDRLAYREELPDPSIDAEQTFDELSARAGAVWAVTESWSIHGSYGESFLPPTVEQLFAFPLFGSNPDLVPQDSRTLEIGARAALDPGLDLALALFDVDTENEIVYVPGAPPDFIGSNENVGRTRRRGIEASLRGKPAPAVTLFGSLTLLDAEIRSGADSGNEVPLVPGTRIAAGVDATLSRRFGVHADALYVGSQVLGNDFANSQAKLDPYTLVNARVRCLVWTGPAGEARGVELFVEVRNVLDERYATRGVYAFDFSTNQPDTFLTPAPDRRLFAGGTWRF